MYRPLEEIVEEYEDLRVNFNSFSKSGDDQKSALLEYQLRFLNLRADLRYWHSKIAGEYSRRDDKSATSIKYRIAYSISIGEFKDDDETSFEKCSMAQAEKLAASTKKYKKFIEQRALFRESFINISDIREELQNYIILVKDRLKL